MKETENKPKRRKVTRACQLCRASHVSCDEKRPCSRCVSRNHPEKCIDIEKPKIPLQFNSQCDKHQFSGHLGETDVISVANSVYSPSVSSPAPNSSFFQLFMQDSELPMDDPLDVFQSLNLNRNPSQPRIPNCFNGQPVSQPKLRDLEELFLPVVGNTAHACQSRDLDACMDCVFNVNNLLPAPPFIPSNEGTGDEYLQSSTMNGTGISNEETVSVVNPSDFDFHSFANLRNELLSLEIESAVANHIEGLVNSLIVQKCMTPKMYTLDMYTQVLDFALANTPSCIFSPTGCIYYCNAAFCDLLSMESARNMKFKCIFGWMDLGGILSLLGACQAQELGSKTKFLRCNFISKESKRQKSCSASVMVFRDRSNWIVAQFIPI